MSISFIDCYVVTISLLTNIVELDISKNWLFSKILHFWFLIDILRIFGNLLEALTYSRQVRDSAGDAVKRLRKNCVQICSTYVPKPKSLSLLQIREEIFVLFSDDLYCCT